MVRFSLGVRVGGRGMRLAGTISCSTLGALPLSIVLVCEVTASLREDIGQESKGSAPVFVLGGVTNGSVTAWGEEESPRGGDGRSGGEDPGG